MSNVITGKIESMKNVNTVIVSVMHEYRHPLYKKAVKRTRRFAVHNEKTDLAVGDMVHIKETKPISKTKHYIVVEKLVK